MRSDKCIFTGIFINKTRITNSPSYKSDHSILSLTIKLNEIKRGPGTWKFNCCLLKNTDYIKIINDTIIETKAKYALPVYDLDNLCQIPDSEIQFSVNKRHRRFIRKLLRVINKKTRGPEVPYFSMEKALFCE